MRSAYRVLGGEEAAEQLVDRMYDKVLQDPRLTPFFVGIDMHRQRQKFRLFLSTILGGPYARTGIELQATHAAVVENGLNQTHLDLFQGHLHTALKEMHVDPDVIEEILAHIERAGAHILGHTPP